jgi:hypothetical protein
MIQFYVFGLSSLSVHIHILTDKSSWLCIHDHATSGEHIKYFNDIESYDKLVYLYIEPKKVEVYLFLLKAGQTQFYKCMKASRSVVTIEW